MKKIIVLLFITSVWLAAIDYKTPYFNENNTRSTSMKYGWMVSTKSTTLMVSNWRTGGLFSPWDIEKYVKLKMRNYYKDLKFTNSGSSNPMRMTIMVELNKYKRNPSLYYGFIMFSCVPDQFMRESASTNYRITNTMIGKDYEIKNLIKENIDLFIERFAEDTYKMQDTVELSAQKTKALMESLKKSN